MASFINLDSIWRDREMYPNPSDYQLTPSQVESWFRSARTIRAFPTNPNTQPLDFSMSVNIKHLILPYDDRIVNLPIIFMDFHSRRYNDIHLIQTINGRHPDARFICIPHKVQNDTNGNPLWIHYNCNMEQVMRFKRDDMMTFKLTTRDGSTLPNFDDLVPDPPDPTKQTIVTFEVTPYLRDGDYGAGDNAMIQPAGVS
jgi:hypothetical protein